MKKSSAFLSAINFDATVATDAGCVSGFAIEVRASPEPLEPIWLLLYLHVTSFLPVVNVFRRNEAEINCDMFPRLGRNEFWLAIALLRHSFLKRGALADPSDRTAAEWRLHFTVVSLRWR